MSWPKTNWFLAIQSHQIIKTSNDLKVVRTRVIGNTVKQMQMSMLPVCCFYLRRLGSLIWMESRKAEVLRQATSSLHIKVRTYFPLTNWDQAVFRYKRNNRQVKLLKLIWETKRSNIFKKRAILHLGSYLLQINWSHNLKIWIQAIIKHKTL